MTDDDVAGDGRSGRAPGEGKRPTITFRCRASLQDKLKAVARDADRSVSEEIERRLDATFNEESASARAARNNMDRLIGFVFREAGSLDNFMTGVQFAARINLSQNRSDAIFASKDIWYRDQHKRQFIESELVKMVPSLIDGLALTLEQQSKESSLLSQLGRLVVESEQLPEPEVRPEDAPKPKQPRKRRVEVVKRRQQ